LTEITNGEVATENIEPSAGFRFGSARWGMMALLMVSIAINYIDRGSLSIAAPVLSKELSLTPEQIGLLLSAFFWSYAGFQIVAGWLADRYSVTVVLGVGYFFWSSITLLTAFANTFAALLVLRILLGIGESLAFPAYSKIITNSFAADRRGFPNSLLDAGLKLGPALGMLLGGLLLARAGWRSLFFVLGFGGMAWLVPWFIWASRNRRMVQTPSSDGPGFLKILSRRDAWGTFIGNFGCNYAYYFLMTWLPYYLVKERGVSLKQMALLASLPLWASAATSLWGGWASDRLITRGASPTVVRKAFVVTGLLASTLILPAGVVRDLSLSMALMVVAYVAFGLFSSNHLAITQTLAGPLAAGKWTGLQNGFANLGGIIAPFLTGLIVSKTGSFFLAFFSASIVAVIGAASYLFVVRQVAPLSWTQESAN
jgi:MFS transporter, ACS family, D-galactonate transporter